jgi:5-methylcytosine-specific restriction protein B
MSGTEKFRSLSVAELGLSQFTSSPAVDTLTAIEHIPPLLDDSDRHLVTVRELMSDNYAGVILSGPPGTGKSFYARRIALTLAKGVVERVRFIQFHPSFQYEDFVQGYIPGATGFEMKNKVFLDICRDALEDTENLYILVIDELSRTDVARVFGEVLTYIERSKRDMEFTLQSGDIAIVPSNVFIVATMNPWDKGVDDVDVALERRFATMNMPPDREQLASMLDMKAVDEAVKTALQAFFDALQKADNEYCRIGHAYFVSATDAASVRRLWNYQLHPYFKRICRSDRETLRKIEGMWKQMVQDKVYPATIVEAPQPNADLGAQ